MSEAPYPGSWTCPAPLRDHDRVVIGHGGGGRLSGELVANLFLPAFGVDPSEALHDAATIELGGQRVAFSTDSYVVRPLFFPGGSIGELAVNGTVNDVSMAGALPIAMSTGFILEEGLSLDVLARVATDMGKAAQRAGVRLATGDTKVVDAGLADGLYINTAGIGLIPEGVDIRPARATPGDRVIVSGPIGQHGIAVMSQREGLQFGTEVRSDTAPLAELVQAMLAACRELHVLRDPTRGGLAASLCEIAAAAGMGIEYEETAVPVPPEVAAACALLGLDAVNVANEGKLVAMVPERFVDDVMAAMIARPDGREAVVIGEVTDGHPGVVVARTAFGARRIVDLPLGEQLPRIC
ncbi:MAG: hydrogenase expression/formation protein HypE [Acidimicrobiales bacterium]